MSGFISCPYLLSVGGETLVTPTFIAAGPVTAGLGNITISLAGTGHAADDILLLFVETNPSASAAPAPPAGYGEVTGSPVEDTSGGAVGQTRLSVFWKRDNGAEADPTVLQSGDHASGVALVFRGCKLTGDPWNAVASGIGTGAETALTLPVVVTTEDHTLIVNMIAHGEDNTDLDNFTGWTNANLTSITEVTDISSTTGTGTGGGAAVGELVAPGSSGSTTVTHDQAERHAYMTIALQGV